MEHINSFIFSFRSAMLFLLEDLARDYGGQVDAKSLSTPKLSSLLEKRISQPFERNLVLSLWPLIRSLALRCSRRTNCVSTINLIITTEKEDLLAMSKTIQAKWTHWTREKPSKYLNSTKSNWNENTIQNQGQQFIASNKIIYR